MSSKAFINNMGYNVLLIIWHRASLICCISIRFRLLKRVCNRVFAVNSPCPLKKVWVTLRLQLRGGWDKNNEGLLHLSGASQHWAPANKQTHETKHSFTLVFNRCFCSSGRRDACCDVAQVSIGADNMAEMWDVLMQVSSLWRLESHNSLSELGVTSSVVTQSCQHFSFFLFCICDKACDFLLKPCQRGWVRSSGSDYRPCFCSPPANPKFLTYDCEESRFRNYKQLLQL